MDTTFDLDRRAPLVSRHRRVPATIADRWSEFLEVTGTPLGLLDLDGRLVAATDRFGRMLGLADSAVADLAPDAWLPELDVHAPMVRQLLAAGVPAHVELARTGPDAEPTRIRLTFVPRRDTNPQVAPTIVRVEDITALRVAQRDRVRSQQRLATIEEEIRHQVGLDCHDGPVQLLAALAIRLSLTEIGSDDETSKSLRRAVDAATAQFRILLSELTGRETETVAETLRRWAQTTVDEKNTRIEFAGDSVRCDHATTLSLWVFLHEIIGGINDRADADARRLIISIEDGGEHLRLDVEIHGSDSAPVSSGTLAARADAANQFAISLGGRFWQGMIAPDVRLVSVRIPAVPSPSHRSSALRPQPDAAATCRRLCPDDDRTPRAVWDLLDESDFEVFASTAGLGVVETHANGRIMTANDVVAGSIGRQAADMVGRPFFEVFADFRQRASGYLERVLAGETVRIGLERPDSSERRAHVRVIVAPRFDDSNEYAGSLYVSEDITQLVLTHHLQRLVWDTFEQQCREANEELAQRLRGAPLRCLIEVRSRLRAFIDSPGGSSEESAALTAIAEELDDSIDRLRSSLDRLSSVQVHEGNLEEALRRSLVAILTESRCRLTVNQSFQTLASDEVAATLVLIAREAVVNALRHGRADRIVVSFEEVEGSVVAEVSDDGIGFDSDNVQDRDGHLGLRSMRGRCALFGGDLAIRSDPGVGTVVTATIPREPPV